MASWSPLQAGTFSLVPRDGETRDLGVVTQSKFIAVGAVATQAQADVSFGPKGLDRMGRRDASADVVATRTEEDRQAPIRLVGMVDARARVAAFTGHDGFLWRSVYRYMQAQPPKD